MSASEAAPATAEPSPPVSAEAKAPRPLRHRARWLIGTLASLALALLLLHAVRTWVLTPHGIDGSSMEPTLHGSGGGRAADLVLLYRLAYLRSGPARWDVVAFRSEGNPAAGRSEDDVVKRVVGLPGETFEIAGGEIYINGEAPPRPPELKDIHYVKSGTFAQDPVLLGPEDYFVLGDNSYLSFDSRRFGPLLRSRIFGKVICVIRKLP